jgi:CrcB protein
MGVLAAYFAFKSGEASQHWRLFLTTGILGGYTTFSTFSLDAMLLYERGEITQAALYVAGSVALAIGGLVAGLVLVRHFS